MIKNIHPFYNKGQKHPAYKNGSAKGRDNRNIQKSIELLGYNCQKCGKDKKILLHHIDGNPGNNNPENWQRLCFKCHKFIHRKYNYKTLRERKKIYREVYYKNNGEANRQKQKALTIKNGGMPVDAIPPEGYIRVSKLPHILKRTRQLVSYQIKKHKIPVEPFGKRTYIIKKTNIKLLTLDRRLSKYYKKKCYRKLTF